MANFPAYERAQRCTGKITPGAAALMAWAVNDYGRGARNLGIYNCRTVRGGPSTSLHAEGRAVDVGFSGFRNPAGTALVNTLLPHVGKLGIQQIIWARRIWSRKHPHGAYYSGVAPHNDHVHIELTWAAARGLTVATIRAAVRGVTPPAVAAPPAAPKPLKTPEEPKPVIVPTPILSEDDMATAYIRYQNPGHRHHGRVEAVGDFHRRHIETRDELNMLEFFGATVRDVDAATFDLLVANKQVVGKPPA